MLRHHASSALLLALLALSGLEGCKRKTQARALTDNDGRSTGKECKLVAGGVIAQDTLLTAGCLITVSEPYAITKGATLTIEPGTKLSFKKGARIEVQDGAIVAKGTAIGPIVFTSSEATPAPGDWGGVVFASKNKPSTLDHVVVEWAGAAPPPAAASPAGSAAAKAAALSAAKSYGMIGLLGGHAMGSDEPLADPKPAIHIARDAAKLTLVESTIRHSTRIGLTSDSAQPFERFENDTFESNGGFAMDVLAMAVGSIASMSSAEPVRVRGAVTSSQSWPKFAGGFVVASLEVASTDPTKSAVLTLAPETLVRVNPMTSLRVGNYHGPGSLVATGVRFTSAVDKPAAGDWAGIRFGKHAPGTTLDGCIIEFAGYDPYPTKPTPSSTTSKTKKTKPASAPPALAVTEWMKDFKVVNTTFRNNAGPGMGRDDVLGLIGAFGGGGTGGCEGLDAPKNGNKSVGQPLCEYHEDPYKSIFGSDNGLSDSALTKGNMWGDSPGDSFGAGGLGMTGTGAGGGGSGSIGLGSVGGIGHGAGTGTGAGYGSGKGAAGGVKQKPATAPSTDP